MSLSIVIAARGGGKSRLAPVLDEAARGALEAAMLADMLDRLSGWPCHVVTPSRELAALVRDSGAAVVPDPGLGLNSAFAATRAALSGAILALPGDLPLVDARDVEAMHAALVPGRAVLAPASDGGTAAVLLPPGLWFDFAFGPASFARHRTTPSVAVSTLGLALDIDTPADVEAFLARSMPGRTRQVLSAAMGRPTPA